MADGKRLRPLDGVVAALLGGGAFTLYTLTLAPTVLPGDAGEFQFVPYLLGVAHPTGYPLYCLLGWLWSHLLPMGDVAFRMNLFSAFWAAVAISLLYVTTHILLRRVFPSLPASARRLLAVLAALVLAGGPTFWSQAIIAEVYSFHIFLCVLTLYFLLSLRPGPQPTGAPTPQGNPASPRSQPSGTARGRGLLLTAFCLGLGLAHHRSTVLLIPAILAYLLLDQPRLLRDRGLAVKAVFLVVLPLSLYLYIPLRAPQTPYLRLPLTTGRELVLYENSLGNLLDFVLGGPFSGSVDLRVDLTARLSMAWGLVVSEIGWLGLALAALGVLWLAVRRQWAVLALTVLAPVLVVAFNLVYIIGDIHVQYIAVYLFLTLLLVTGAGAVVQLLGGAWSKVSRGDPVRVLKGRTNDVPTTVMAAAVVLPILVLAAWTAAGNYASLDQSGNRQESDRWEQILSRAIPEDAVLVSNDRDDIMPMWYKQYVGNGQTLRPDLLGLYPLITPQYATLGRVLDLALTAGRPVYLIKDMPGIEVKVDVQPDAGLWHVRGLAAGAEPGHSVNGSLAGVLALTGYDQTPLHPSPGDSLAISLYWEALRSPQAEYHSFVHLLDSAGQKVAQSDRQPGGVYYPTDLWLAGERLRDDHLLVIPADAQPGVYDLSVGMYVLSSDGSLTSLGAPLVVGQIEIAFGTSPGTGPADGVRSNLGSARHLPIEP